MKKSILTLTILILLTLCFCITADANDGEGTGSRGEVRSLSVQTYPEKTVYGAFELLDTDGLSLRVIYDDGSEEIVDGEKLTVSYSRDTCFRVGDGEVRLSYGGKSIMLPVTVNRIAYDLDVLEVDNFSVTYNGKYQSYTEMLPDVVGRDGIPLVMSAAGGSTNAGSYDISIDFFTESKDYLTPDSRVVTMTIEPAKAEIVWSNVSFVYDGRSKAPTASYVDVSGTRVYPPVSGAATNAGGAYIARAAVSDPNYEFINTTVSFEIKKADYDFSSVIWSEDSFTYDGTKKSISASGLPGGVSIVGYSGDRGTDAGNYTVTASLSWDRVNYNTPDPLTHSWEILPAEYDMSGVTFLPTEAVYDGNMHYPRLDGVMPVGADGKKLEYCFSTGACHVSDGVVSVIVSFRTDSKNYVIPEPMYSSASVTPLGISVKWGKDTISYSGLLQAPEAYSSHCQVTVNGAGLTVGSYTATAVTDNGDYYILNDTMKFSIIKAQNLWTSTPGFTTCYEGRELKLGGISKFGVVEYTYFSDPLGNEQISAPTACGKYYAVATVAGTANYEGIRSDIFSFEIVPIRQVSFLAAIEREELRAFQRLSANDISCSVINNDGSVTPIDPSLVSIIYENADSFRKGDETVTLKYDKFLITLEVEIGYADYDLSGVYWQNDVQTYDGSPKSPTLSGLPEGVSVIEYTGGEVINAGSYRVYAVLDYDSENYNAPDYPACDFVINKQSLDIPLVSAVYNGREQLPISDSPLYTLRCDTAYTSAGDYAVTAILTDADNYTFVQGQGDRCSAIFRILPATLKVTVSDVKLHLFESLSLVEYTVTEGRIIGDDVISVSCYALDKQAFVRSENPNYVFEVTSGRITRLPYPTLGDSIKIMILLLILLLLAFCVLLCYKRRHKIKSFMAILRCRWHNRHLTVAAPEGVSDSGASKRYFGLNNEDPPELYPPEERETEGDAESLDRGGEEMSTEEYEILSLGVDADRADKLISDSMAKNLLRKNGDVIFTEGGGRATVNLDSISESFSAGDRVDINILKEKKLIPADTAYVKILARGKLDKPLTVYANDFSLSAVKMIALTGGEAIKCITADKKIP